MILGCMTELPCPFRNDIDGVGHCIKSEGDCEYQLLEENTVHWLKWENGKEWGEIQCPMLGNVYIMTYYSDAPCYYTYTAPFIDDGDICYYRFDHDEGCWNDNLFYLSEYVDGIPHRLYL